MNQITRKNESKANLISAIVKGMQDKKAQEISVLDLKKIGSRVTNYFVICSGEASTQIEAIADSIIDVGYKEAGQRPWKKEGFINKEWILLDYVDVIVHIFQREKREFYALDRLWADADITQF